MAKVRIGIFLIVFSWLPIAQVALIIAHNHQRLTSADASDSFRLTVWAIQVVIGLVGVWLVGKVAVDAAKTSGCFATAIATRTNPVASRCTRAPHI
jgi:hypothetical protein